MATIDQLVIEIKAETDQLRKEMKKVNKALDKTNKQTTTLARGMKGIFGVAVIAGVGKMGKKVVDTSRTFEDLRATLIAVTQSTKAADAGFQIIERFTATTTFQLEDVTAGFIKLIQAGVTPTIKKLTEIGNVAAANNTSFFDMADAIFKAGTGEFDTMKKFAIVLRKEGDEITTIFDGVPKKIDNSREAIAEFIQELGRERFAGAIAKRADTLTGAFSNLGDATATAANKVGEAGLSRALGDAAIKMKEGLNEGSLLADFLGGTFAVAVNIIVGVFEALEVVLQGIVNGFKHIKEWGQKAWDWLPERLTKPLEEGMDSDADPYGIKSAWEQIKPKKSEKKGEVKTTEELEQDFAAATSGLQAVTEESAALIEMNTVLQEVLMDTSAAFTKDFVDALMEGENALESFKDFAKNMVSQIISTFLQLAVVNQIINSIFNLTGTDALPTMKWGSNQSGGAVQPNQPTLVGEGGPELFVPNSTGRIMNSMNTRSALGGGQNIVINQNLNFATGVVPTVRTEITKMLPQIADITKACVFEAASRGGQYGKVLRGAG